jgi:hypothetical protein
MDVTAIKNTTAMLRSATTAPGANGTVSQTTAAGMNNAIGAARKIQRSALLGERFSLLNSLKTSAAGCKSPRGPTRLGPKRSWIYADALRSAIVSMAARFRTRNNIAPNESRNLNGSWFSISNTLRTSYLSQAPETGSMRPIIGMMSGR